MSSRTPTVVTVVGARPQFIKAAPVSRALRDAGIREILVHTGQHFDDSMSGQFFRELGMEPPAHQLAINSLGHGAMTGRMLEAVETILLQEKPDALLTYGDTNSTLAGALAAAKLHIPVAHVEAGLRSFNRAMPEEINRILVDHMSALLFCPTETAIAHLAAENITHGVSHVGDVMMDATIDATKRAATQSTILADLALAPKTYAVCTLHRAENTDSPERFAALIAWLEAQGAHTQIVMPVHPRTRKILAALPTAPQHLRLIDPLGYLDMAWLVHHATAVFTDSGGLQKEAYFHRVPCVTLRDETEWVETIAAGWNRLWTVADYQPRRDIADYGNGDASARIAQQLKAFLAAR
ncbi:MAG: UDP-N-acetylglucosamine 2-epimerase (non-hydrolyzing) [Pseudomonadota bacterium]